MVELERMIVLVGRPGVGKTSVRRVLADRLGMTPFGPDDHCHRWDWVIRQVDCNARPLVECCKVPRALRARMDTRATLIELTASPEEQRRRLTKQGLDREFRERLLREDGSLGYEFQLKPHLTIDATDLTPEEAADRIVTEVGEGRK